MNVLSLFDGMSCGMIALVVGGYNVERYVSFENETKYATKTASHNFSVIEQRGDVFDADFTEFEGFDLLCGGSPCTYWSIAQKNNRETEASGMGWELFSHYVRALHEAKPRFFVYENNKSMSNAIRESITQTFGFEPICINSALVSAQNRQRLYWVGKRNDDGTYSRVKVEQPEDRGILLRDILDGVTDREKGRCVLSSIGRTTTREYFKKDQGTMTFEPVTSTVLNINPSGKGINGAVGRIDAKSRCLTTNKGEGQKIIVPVGVGYRGRMDNGKWVKRYESNEQEKANAITTAQTDSMVAQPIRVGALPRPNGELSTSQAFRVYSADGKSVNITAGGGGAGGKTGLYAIPVEFDGETPIKAISAADGKTYPVYEVKDRYITIKGKSYPIKLVDGFYIIRKLTVRECMRLQTVPEWYEFPVSDSQAYKMLGNGWTVEVISHILSFMDF
jgi:DNA (cytosine-5)-methyltransferase 3A